jgi:hypothetical protein
VGGGSRLSSATRLGVFSLRCHIPALADPPRPFDFLIHEELLRLNLHKHLLAKQISTVRWCLPPAMCCPPVLPAMCCCLLLRVLMFLHLCLPAGRLCCHTTQQNSAHMPPPGRSPAPLPAT